MRPKLLFTKILKLSYIGSRKFLFTSFISLIRFLKVKRDIKGAEKVKNIKNKNKTILIYTTSFIGIHYYFTKKLTIIYHVKK